MNSSLYMYLIILLVQLSNPYLINGDISSPFIAIRTQCLLMSETGLPGQIREMDPASSQNRGECYYTSTPCHEKTKIMFPHKHFCAFLSSYLEVIQNLKKAGTQGKPLSELNVSSLDFQIVTPK